MNWKNSGTPVLIQFVFSPECDLNMCGDDSSTCSNLEGGYSCGCNDGFEFDHNVYGASCQGKCNPYHIVTHISSVTRHYTNFEKKN